MPVVVVLVFLGSTAAVALAAVFALLPVAAVVVSGSREGTPELHLELG